MFSEENFQVFEILGKKPNQSALLHKYTVYTTLMGGGELCGLQWRKMFSEENFQVFEILGKKPNQSALLHKYTVHHSSPFKPKTQNP
jgi:acyl-CoA-binding protein